MNSGSRGKYRTYVIFNFEVYLSSMAIINGAKSVDDVVRTLKTGFMSVMRVRLLFYRMPLKVSLTLSI